MSSHSARGTRHSALARAFTLVELLVVIGIIAVLAALLFPAIGALRTKSYVTSTQAFLSQIDAACQAYKTTYGAYPGPFSNLFLAADTQQIDGRPLVWVTHTGNKMLTGTGQTATSGSVTAPRITGTENLVLGLMGGLTKLTTGEYAFNADELGQGPRIFNINSPSRATPFMANNKNLSAYGDTFMHFEEDSSRIGSATTPTKDSAIPEFVDSFSSPMPILYMRARLGATMTPNPAKAANGIAVSEVNSQGSTYNLLEVLPYTSSSIGEGKSVKPERYVKATYNAAAPHGLVTNDPANSTIKEQASYAYPFDAFDYLTEPASYDRTKPTLTPADQGRRQARKAESYVLIAAGKDRVYGTEDDITNFGSVLP